MNIPVLDNRTLDDVRAEVVRLARSYTPEWRCESPEDDPGAAIAELFSAMFHEIIDRRNALPEHDRLSGARPGARPRHNALFPP